MDCSDGMHLNEADRVLLFAIARGFTPEGDRRHLRQMLFINSNDQITGRGLVALTMNGWSGPLPVAARPDRPIAGNRWADMRTD